MLGLSTRQGFRWDYVQGVGFRVKGLGCRVLLLGGFM